MVTNQDLIEIIEVEAPRHALEEALTEVIDFLSLMQNQGDLRSACNAAVIRLRIARALGVEEML